MRAKTNIVRQAERLRRGEINRRRFIMSALATGVTLPTATSLAQKAQAAQPKSGGTLRFGIATADRLAEVRAMATGNTLLQTNPTGALVGDLARGFEATDQGRIWAFDLHPDAVFSTGAPVDADVVVASLTGQSTPGLQGQVADIRADGPKKVIIELVRPNADFAWVLTDPDLTVKDPTGVGSGAYVPSPDQRHLRRLSDHWGAGQGHFDAIDLIALPDPAERLNALLNGEVDLIDDVDPRTFGLLANTPDIKLAETEAASVFGLIRQPGTAPDVGRALSDVTDRRDLAQKVLLGHGRQQGCSGCMRRAELDAPVTLGAERHAFPGSSEFVDLIARMAKDKGLPVVAADPSNFKAQRLRLRPTLDWTLAELLAHRPSPDLAALVDQARANTSADEKAALRTRALQVLEDQGDLFPLIANDIHAHRAALHHPDGPFDAHRIVTRGWFE